MPRDSTNSEPVVWLNDSLLLQTALAITPANSGILTGWGVFETLAFRSGHPICFSRHYARLAAGAERLGIDPPSATDLREAIPKCVAANDLESARIRITLTSDPVQPATKTLISAVPLIVPESPSKVTIVPFQRNPSSPLSGIKATSYAENILALRLAQSLGADDALLCDTSGNLSEAATANLFFVHSGILHTPPLTTGCLPGTIRGLVIELFEKRGIRPVVAPTPPQFLFESSEAFLTSSIRGIQPISTVDSTPLPSSPGPITEKAMRWLGDLLQKYPDPPLK